MPTDVLKIIFNSFEEKQEPAKTFPAFFGPGSVTPPPETGVLSMKKKDEKDFAPKEIFPCLLPSLCVISVAKTDVTRVNLPAKEFKALWFGVRKITLALKIEFVWDSSTHR